MLYVTCIHRHCVVQKKIMLLCLKKSYILLQKTQVVSKKINYFLLLYQNS